MPITKKPWKRKAHLIVGNLRIDGDTYKGDVVCSLKGHINFANMEDNGRMIEQAPEMLESLKETTNMLLEMAKSLNKMPVYGGVINTAIAIINKVEGK